MRSVRPASCSVFAITEVRRGGTEVCWSSRSLRAGGSGSRLRILRRGASHDYELGRRSAPRCGSAPRTGNRARSSGHALARGRVVFSGVPDQLDLNPVRGLVGACGGKAGCAFGFPALRDSRSRARGDPGCGRSAARPIACASQGTSLVPESRSAEVGRGGAAGRGGNGDHLGTGPEAGSGPRWGYPTPRRR